MSIPKYWVKAVVEGTKKIIKVHHGADPLSPLAGPFNTEDEAKEAKAEIIKNGTAVVQKITKRTAGINKIKSKKNHNGK